MAFQSPGSGQEFAAARFILQIRLVPPLSSCHSTSVLVPITRHAVRSIVPARRFMVRFSSMLVHMRKKYVILGAVAILLYVIGGVYLYWDFGDQKVCGYGMRYSNGPKEHDMGDSSTWQTESVYIPTGLHCRLPDFMERSEYLQEYSYYISLPYRPLRGVIAKMKYPCYMRGGCVYEVISREEAQNMIDTGKYMFAEAENSVWR